MRGTISVPNGLARLADSSKFARKGTTVAVTVEFAAGQSFTVRALLWEGKPFLSFDPYRP